MKNPWLDLPRRAPFVAPSDKADVVRFNDRMPPEDQLRTELLPMPYLGNPSAPIVLLSLNPGYNPKDDKLQATPRFMRAWRKALRHEGDGYPYFFLNNAVEGVSEGPACHWWRRVFRSILADREIDIDVIARSFFCIEFFPYRSCHYRPLQVESQQYGFALLRSAMKRNALVVIMRSRRDWLNAVPELESYRNVVVTRNPRAHVLSEGNIPDGYRRIKQLLVKAGTGISRFNDTRGFRVGVDAQFISIPDHEKPYLKKRA